MLLNEFDKQIIQLCDTDDPESEWRKRGKLGRCERQNKEKGRKE